MADCFRNQSRNHRFWSGQRLGIAIFSAININDSRRSLEADRHRGILDRVPFKPWSCNWCAARCFLSRVHRVKEGAAVIGLAVTLQLDPQHLRHVNHVALPFQILLRNRIGHHVARGILVSRRDRQSCYPRLPGNLTNPSISLNVNIASMGMFLGNAMGPYMSMEMFGYVSLIPNILFMVLFSLIPESPYHYALQGNIDEAEASLKWFRREADVKAEIQELQDFVDGASTSVSMKLKAFLLPVNLKNIFIMLGLNIFVQASSFSTINAYTEIIVVSTKVNITPSIAVMALCFATVAAGFITILLVDRFGRKNLLILSSIGVTVSFAALGLHFHLLSLNFDPVSLTWLPIASLLSFNIFVSCGLSTVPSTLVGEMFPANLKNLASLCIFSSNALLTFAFVKSYQPFVNLAGETIVFWSYGLFVLGAVPYVRYLIPETTGKSLLEIQQSIKK
ncbi:trehalose transporter 1-like protein isoform X2 [Temnothorax americanus]|uniref:trehalose transporter 1-like protein isoform X2 n=1 Tax=Temnothorax americanus TaxID=1964332 RepID=UPI0040696A96